MKSKKKKRKKGFKATAGDIYHVGTITREQILKMARKADRDLAISAGAYTRSGAGTGAHGGDKKETTKRSRKTYKLEIRKGNMED